MTPLSSFEVGATIVDAGHRHRLKFDDEAEYAALVNRMAVGSSVLVSISEEKPHRKKTWEQVKYWKGCVCPLIAEHCGMTDKQADLAMLGEKYGYVDGPMGHQIPCETSIVDFTVEQMTELIDWVLDWAPAHLEVVLPPPDKKWKQRLEEDERRSRGKGRKRRAA